MIKYAISGLAMLSWTATTWAQDAAPESPSVNPPTQETAPAEPDDTATAEGAATSHTCPETVVTETVVVEIPVDTPAPTLISSDDHLALAEAIVTAGHDAELVMGEAGPASITVTVAGVETALFFNACRDEPDCGVALFSAGFDTGRRNRPDRDTIADWNAQTLLTKAYVDDEGDPYLEMAVNLKHGVSVDNFTETLAWWEASVDAFMAEIDF